MFTQEFQNAFDNLNVAQREAVEKIYGPVMVIAGPGTGKTQILSTRIGHILSQTDTQASNILCLTYTEAGTVAMRKRLTKLIGPEAHHVHIHTYHSFCNHIIQSYSDLFSEHNDLKPVDDLERLELYIKLMDSWPAEHILKRLKSKPYLEANKLHKLFGIMKSEGWSSEFVVQNIDRYLSELPFKDEFIYKRKSGKYNKGDIKEDAIKKEEQKMERLRQAALSYDTFQNLMQSEGRYDYADMILWVIEALSTEQNLRYDLMEQFQFILVDEYQDTNGSQNKLIFSLAGAPEDNPNIFVVGDDDQAIYRFQGANLANIENFIERFKNNLAMVVLEDNYRSSSKIISAAEDVIQHNQQRLTNITKLDKNLNAAGTLNSTFNTGIILGEFDTEIDELIAVEKYIEQLLDKGVNPTEIAVLYRTRKQVQPLINYFKTQSIAYDVKNVQNIFDEPFIDHLLSLLKYLHNEIKFPFQGSHDLFNILHYPWFKINTLDLATIAVSKYDNENVSWRKKISDVDFLSKLELNDSQKIKSVSVLLESWVKNTINENLQQLLESILYSPQVFNYIKGHDDSLQILKCATSLFEFIKEQTDKNKKFNIDDFLEVIEKMKENELPISSISIEKTGKGIQFMTAHGSKGLEFEHVVVIGCNDKKWEKKTAPSSGFSIPSTLIISNTPDKIEDERRLFYVCLTRAKKEVFLTFTKEYLNGKSASPSRFTTELEKNPGVERLNSQATNEEKHAFLLSQYAPKPKLQSKFPAQIDDIIDQMTWNISGLNKYLNCPVAFYYENILRVPQALSANMTYGNAIHHGLEYFFKHAKEKQEGVFPPKTELIRYFHLGMDKYQPYFTEKQFDDYRKNGELKLASYYDDHIDYWKTLKDFETELRIRNVEIEGTRVTGIFDRIDIFEDGVRIVDYKTGNPRYAKSKLKTPETNTEELLEILETTQNSSEREKLRLKLNGGDYWRQLVFYKLLHDSSPEMTKSFIEAYLSFTDSDTEKYEYMYSIKISREDERVVKAQLKKAVQDVKEKKFYNGCGLDTCKWCQLNS